MLSLVGGCYHEKKNLAATTLLLEYKVRRGPKTGGIQASVSKFLSSLKGCCAVFLLRLT